MTRSLILVLVLPVVTLAAACGSDTTSTPSQALSSQPAGLTSTSNSSAATESNPAGDIPDTTAFVVATDSQSHVSVMVPEGWARRDDGAGSTFSDHFNTIRVETVAAAATPTVDSARSVEAPKIAAGPGKVASIQVSSVQRAAGTAVLITYTADSAPDPVTQKVAREAVERYEFWRAGVEAIVTLSSPVGSDNVDPWKTVTDSLLWR